MSLNSSSRSSASGSKSKKRIFNSTSTASKHSNSSDNARSSNTSKKKKLDQNQKTLGMAWGSNSRSTSRSVFRNSPFPDFGSYMALKNHKLHQQFSAEAASSSHSDSTSQRPIFEGVSIFVDGYTVPSSQELRGYMLKHGGRFENYFSRHSVTHIICSNLPDSKIKNLRSFSGGLPVVKPTWILESVAANKLLSWVPYQLNQLASETNNQPKLSTFFSRKSCKVSNYIVECSAVQATSETGDLSPASSLNEDDNFIGDSKSTEHSGERHLVSADLVHLSNAGCRDEPTGNYIGCQNHDDATAESGSCCGLLSENHANEDSFSVNDNSIGNKKLSNSECIQPVSRGHSTLLDPNFVENYFKFSRLHFIGTWRNRYRKRFPTLSSGFRYRSSSDNASAMSQKTVIIHIDMDCFFVSVVIRKKPDFKEKAVAVCHSDSSRGTAEISSANYPARAYGVKAGMFVRDARALCPQLVIFPYDFKAYEEVADQFYDILHKYCDKVQAVSCDEAFLDVTDSGIEDPLLLASSIRKDILDTTGCTASVGIANNMLMARVATGIAKPDGQCCIPLEKVDDYLCELPVKALPGIGRVLEDKLKRIEVKTCGQLRMISKDSLQKDFGLKTGDMLWNFSRGIDNRLVGVFQESKSIGAEVNWGVRFNDLNDARKFIVALSKEVSLRLQGCGVLGRTFTLKMKKRKSEAGEPVKYMGCGNCDNLSRSITLPLATDDVDVLQRITIQLFGYFHIDAKDIRGMGLQASKLESADDSKQGHEKNSIRSWLVSSSARARCSDIASKSKLLNKHFNESTGIYNSLSHFGLFILLILKKSLPLVREGQLHSDPHSRSAKTDSGFSTGEAHVTRDLTLPALQDLDLGVIEMLPAEVFSEINSLYGGELTRLISKKREKHVDDFKTFSVPQIDQGSANEEGFDCTILSKKAVETPRSSVMFGNLAGSSAKGDKEQEKQHLNEMAPLVPVSHEGVPNPDIASPPLELNNLMPLSLTQVDCSVLQQLPEELKVDILESLPAHRSSNLASNNISSEFNMHDFVSVKPVLINELWVGCPPKWVENFRVSNCRVLNTLALLFQTSGATCQLSSILQQSISRIHLPLDLGLNGMDDSVNCLCELIEQYVKLKVETDIEEIYICVRLLRRLALRSELFLKVYERTIPLLQSAIGESYGGNLNIASMEYFST